MIDEHQPSRCDASEQDRTYEGGLRAWCLQKLARTLGRADAEVVKIVATAREEIDEAIRTELADEARIPMSAPRSGSSRTRSAPSPTAHVTRG